MKICILITALFIVAFAAYGIDHGIYVGFRRYAAGADCCSDLEYIQKRCRYLFVTGISEIDAQDGRVSAPRARNSQAALETALLEPDNGYCRLFAQ